MSVCHSPPVSTLFLSLGKDRVSRWVRNDRNPERGGSSKPTREVSRGVPGTCLATLSYMVLDNSVLCVPKPLVPGAQYRGLDAEEDIRTGCLPWSFTTFFRPLLPPPVSFLPTSSSSPTVPGGDTPPRGFCRTVMSAQSSLTLDQLTLVLHRLMPKHC